MTSPEVNVNTTNTPSIFRKIIHLPYCKNHPTSVREKWLNMLFWKWYSSLFEWKTQRKWINKHSSIWNQVIKSNLSSFFSKNQSLILSNQSTETTESTLPFTSIAKLSWSITSQVTAIQKINRQTSNSCKIRSPVKLILVDLNKRIFK